MQSSGSNCDGAGATSSHNENLDTTASNGGDTSSSKVLRHGTAKPNDGLAGTMNPDVQPFQPPI